MFSEKKRSRILHGGSQHRLAVTGERAWREGKGKVWKVMGSVIYLGAQIVIKELQASSLMMPAQSLLFHTQQFY